MKLGSRNLHSYVTLKEVGYNISDPFLVKISSMEIMREERKREREIIVAIRPQENKDGSNN